MQYFSMYYSFDVHTAARTNVTCSYKFAEHAIYHRNDRQNADREKKSQLKNMHI